jgi:hypothetical protein
MAWLPLAPTASSVALTRPALLRRTPRAEFPAAIPPAGRFLLPNVAAMLMAVTLFYCLLLNGGGQSLFRDSDTGWHIRNGERILNQRALPASDPYSFSKPDAPWLAWEWLSDALMGAANQAGGLTAITALFAMAIAATAWLWTRLNFALDGDFLLTGLLAPLMISATNPHWLARPHIFSWLLLLSWMLLLERPIAPAWRSCVFACAFTALWANLHASFLLAPGIAAIYAISRATRPHIWPLDRKEEYGYARRYALIALAGLAGSLVNPYGWRLHEHVLSFLTDTRLTSQIAEFQPVNFADPTATLLLIVLSLAAFAAVLSFTQRNIAHAILAGLFFWAGLRSARMIPLAALIILPIANSALTAALRGTRNLRQSLAERLDSALAYSARLHRFDMQLNSAAFTLAVLALALVTLRAPAYARSHGFAANEFPIAAAGAIETLPANARILSTDHFGGYLIYRFDGSRKVFFDGRSDFYGADFLTRYTNMMAARPGWRETLTHYRFTHALLPPDSPLAAALIEDGWNPIYRDRVATLLEAR